LACPITSSHLSDVKPDGWAFEFVQQFQHLCSLCSLCSSWRATGLELGTPLKHLRTTQDLVPEGLLNHSEGLRSTFSKTGTQSDAHALFLTLTHRENRHTSRTRLQINACGNWPRPPSYMQHGTMTH
jgi:hypothetical protein